MTGERLSGCCGCPSFTDNFRWATKDDPITPRHGWEAVNGDLDNWTAPATGTLRTAEAGQYLGRRTDVYLDEQCKGMKVFARVTGTPGDNRVRVWAGAVASNEAADKLIEVELKFGAEDAGRLTLYVDGVMKRQAKVDARWWRKTPFGFALMTNDEGVLVSLIYSATDQNNPDTVVASTYIAFTFGVNYEMRWAGIASGPTVTNNVSIEQYNVERLETPDDQCEADDYKLWPAEPWEQASVLSVFIRYLVDDPLAPRLQCSALNGRSFLLSANPSWDRPGASDDYDEPCTGRAAWTAVISLPPLEDNGGNPLTGDIVLAAAWVDNQLGLQFALYDDADDVVMGGRVAVNASTQNGADPDEPGEDPGEPRYATHRDPAIWHDTIGVASPPEDIGCGGTGHFHPNGEIEVRPL